MTALVVDDEFLLRFSYVDMLEDLVEGVMEADDGLPALEILRSNPNIDFVISDCNMKQMDGDELLSAMRQAGDMRPFVMISGESGDSRKAAEDIIAQAGNAVFLSKPTTLAEILKAIESLSPVDAYAPDIPTANMG